MQTVDQGGAGKVGSIRGQRGVWLMECNKFGLLCTETFCAINGTNIHSHTGFTPLTPGPLHRTRTSPRAAHTPRTRTSSRTCTPTPRHSPQDSRSGELGFDGVDVDSEVLKAVPPLGHLDLVLCRLPQPLQLFRVLHKQQARFFPIAN
jgi:hypothetical protein